MFDWWSWMFRYGGCGTANPENKNKKNIINKIINKIKSLFKK